MEVYVRNKAIISERGTVTIPEAIRQLAGIHPGDLIEFLPKENFIILRHLIVAKPEKEFPLSNDEWKRFDKLVQKQLKKGQYTSYRDLEKASQHSPKLLRK